MPLADDMRPTSFDDAVGQESLFGQGGILRAMATGEAPLRSLVLYGPPGCGKTTAALVIAHAANKPLVRLNATNATVSDIKDAVKKADGPFVLYLDEIQYFNKRQQQSLLPYVEDGSVVLVASTTENPYHNVYDAILSRCLVLELSPLSPEQVRRRLDQVLDETGRADDVADDARDCMSRICSGDMRRALNMLELMLDTHAPGTTIYAADVTADMPGASMAGFDMDGSSHYEYVSALQKSIRGSDPDAAVFWLAKLLEGDDVISPCRRLLVIACEDVGLACPDAISHTLSCVEAAQTLGLPEAYMPLTQAVVFLALAPKSSSNEPAWQAAREDIRNGLGTSTPRHLRKSCAVGYVWPHAFPNHWIPQQYMPDDLVGRTYYTPGDNPVERSMYAHWADVRAAWAETQGEAPSWP